MAAPLETPPRAPLVEAWHQMVEAGITPTARVQCPDLENCEYVYKDNTTGLWNVVESRRCGAYWPRPPYFEEAKRKEDQRVQCGVNDTAWEHWLDNSSNETIYYLWDIGYVTVEGTKYSEEWLQFIEDYCPPYGVGWCSSLSFIGSPMEDFFDSVQQVNVTTVNCTLNLGADVNTRKPVFTWGCVKRWEEDPLQIPFDEFAPMNCNINGENETALIFLVGYVERGLKRSRAAELAKNDPNVTKPCPVPGVTEVMDFMIDAGLDVNAEDVQGQTAIFDVVCPERLQLLVDQGADVNHISKNLQTPLMAAIVEKRADLIEVLLENDADYSEMLTGYNPIDFVFANCPGQNNGWGQVLQVLMEENGQAGFSGLIQAIETGEALRAMYHVLQLIDKPLYYWDRMTINSPAVNSSEFPENPDNPDLPNYWRYLDNRNDNYWAVLDQKDAQTGLTPLRLALSKCDWRITAFLNATHARCGRLRETLPRGYWAHYRVDLCNPTIVTMQEWHAHCVARTLIEEHTGSEVVLIVATAVFCTMLVVMGIWTEYKRRQKFADELARVLEELRTGEVVTAKMWLARNATRLTTFELKSIKEAALDGERRIADRLAWIYLQGTRLLSWKELCHDLADEPLECNQLEFLDDDMFKKRRRGRNQSDPQPEWWQNPATAILELVRDNNMVQQMRDKIGAALEELEDSLKLEVGPVKTLARVHSKSWTYHDTRNPAAPRWRNLQSAIYRRNLPYAAENDSRPFQFAVMDYVRMSITAVTPPMMINVVRRLRRGFPGDILAIKNGFRIKTRPPISQYRDVKVLIAMRFKDGIRLIVEIQIILGDWLSAKKESSCNYKVRRAMSSETLAMDFAKYRQPRSPEELNYTQEALTRQLSRNMISPLTPETKASWNSIFEEENKASIQREAPVRSMSGVSLLSRTFSNAFSTQKRKSVTMPLVPSRETSQSLGFSAASLGESDRKISESLAWDGSGFEGLAQIYNRDTSGSYANQGRGISGLSIPGRDTSSSYTDGLPPWGSRGISGLSARSKIRDTSGSYLNNSRTPLSLALEMVPLPPSSDEKTFEPTISNDVTPEKTPGPATEGTQISHGSNNETRTGGSSNETRTGEMGGEATPMTDGSRGTGDGTRMTNGSGETGGDGTRTTPMTDGSRETGDATRMTDGETGSNEGTRMTDGTGETGNDTRMAAENTRTLSFLQGGPSALVVKLEEAESTSPRDILRMASPSIILLHNDEEHQTRPRAPDN